MKFYEQYLSIDVKVPGRKVQKDDFYRSFLKYVFTENKLLKKTADTTVKGVSLLSFNVTSFSYYLYIMMVN